MAIWLEGFYQRTLTRAWDYLRHHFRANTRTNDPSPPVDNRSWRDLILSRIPPRLIEGDPTARGVEAADGRGFGGAYLSSVNYDVKVEYPEPEAHQPFHGC